MAEEIFTLDKLKDFDGGRILAAVQEEMKYIGLSCRDRPNDKTPRKVTLEISMVPVAEPNTGACEGVSMSFKAKSKVPERKSKTYQLGIKQTGAVVYSSNNPENVNQRHIDDVLEKKPAKGGVGEKPAVKPEVETKPKAKSVVDDL